MRQTVIFIFFLQSIAMLLGGSLLAQDAETFNKDQMTWVKSTLAGMSQEEKIGQLFMVAAYSNKTEAHYKEIERLIESYKIGGLIFFQGTPEDQVRLTNRYQKASDLPLLIAIDGEWGLGMRLKRTVSFPRQIMLGAIQDNRLIEEMGVEVARQCKRIGVHINLAPVVDVNNNPNNPVINNRSFGENKFNVAKKSAAYMQGMEKSGVMACAKHFPGHGDTDKDSHLTLPLISHDAERLNDIELYPFQELAQLGIGSMMIAHLAIPALEPNSIDGRINPDLPYMPVSLSKKVVTDLLKKKMGYDGLVITDALNMKGVANYFEPGEVDLQAFLAGNDILLFPEDVATAVNAIANAISAGKVSKKELDRRVRKILKAKYRAGLANFRPINDAALFEDLNNAKVEVLKRKLISKALTLARNERQMVPLKRLQNAPFASLSIGRGAENPFTETLEKYVGFNNFEIGHKASAADGLAMVEKLESFDTVVVGVHKMSSQGSKDYGYSLKFFDEIETVLMSYEDNRLTNEISAQLLFGAIPPLGKLPITASPMFQYGQGIESRGQQRLRYGIPEEVGIKSADLQEVDSLVQKALDMKATPGCQVLIAKDNMVIYEKSFGYHTYDEKIPVKSSDLYDIASITKIAGSLPALMHLYENKQLHLDSTLGAYLDMVKDTNKDTLKVRDILVHQAGLRSWIPFYKETLPEKGKVNEAFSEERNNEFSVEVAQDMYMREAFVDTMWQRILNSDVAEDPEYVYSDLGYYFFKEMAEKQLKMPMEKFLQMFFYSQLGMNNTAYKARRYFPVERLVPSEKDEYFRLQTLQGHVHDMGAAMLGGVGGHAGLFSNANDLAKMMQLYLNGGKYGSQNYLHRNTINTFTQKQAKDNRRGLGFDKPELNAKKRSPCAECVSPRTFGHSGFTGTCVWADPAHNLIYVFLSNRVYPTMNNRKLVDKNIRTEIQDVIYRAILGEQYDSVDLTN